jgi:A/G-specific adenine glycosylase
VARRRGTADRLPEIRRPPTIRQKVRRIWAVRDGALLLQRAPSHAARLSGLLELPRAEDAGVTAGSLPPSALLACHARTITRHAIKESIFRVDPASLPEAGRSLGLEWVPIDELGSKSLSGPHRRWIRGLLADAAPGSAGPPAPANQPSVRSR